MIKILDLKFLEDLIEELDVSRPDEWYDTFNDIYRNIINQYCVSLELNEDATECIEHHIFFNYMDSSVDLSIERFLEKFPEYKDKESELEDILYT